ncbi:MAG: ROK family protein [Verrucomicrobia bacterium]|nr:ROK family protein [Verrucomicrobiota bacterium]
MNNAPFTALGIDVGGTKIAAGIVTFPDGRVHLRRQIPTLPARGGEAVLDDVFQLATELATEAGSHNFQVNAIGLGMCELVNTDGDIVSASSLPWQSADVREGLATIAPTVIEADVRAAALAEALFGAGKSQCIFVYITVGTGISSCLVIEGRPFLGARGATGTLASSLLPHLGQPWGSGATATLEQIASGPALVARFNQLHGHARSGQEVVAAAQAGNAGALSVVRSAGEALGATIAWLVNVLDPQCVIIGGGLGLSEGAYWESLVASARKTIWSDTHRNLPIVRATTGADAGLIGAAAAAWKKFS